MKKFWNPGVTIYFFKTMEDKIKALNYGTSIKYMIHALWEEGLMHLQKV